MNEQEQKVNKSKKIKIAAIIVGVFLIALIIFASGVAVGLHKAKFSCDWGKNYERNFMGPRINDMERPGFLPGPPPEFMNKIEGRDFRNAHGLSGEIISIADNTIVIKDRDNKENTVAVTEKTMIKSRQNDLKISDLKQGDKIIIMGKPGDNGVVNADLIRIFDNNNESN